MSKIKAGILGATGAVGQRFIQLLENHPWFEITALAASDRSSGGKYTDACNWRLATPLPERVRALEVQPCRPPLDCDFVFSGLPSSVAGELEEEFAQAGYPVISNSMNHRMDEDVPLLVPEINHDHIGLIDIQRKRRGYTTGYIVTNPNCSAIALALGLAPLHNQFGLEAVVVTTMQALSGAGYPGVPSLDIIDNVIPFIKDEEPKLEEEPLKIFGKLTDDKIVFADFLVSAQCHRVNVQDGHLEAVRIRLKKKADEAELIAALENYSSLPQEMRLPSAPARPVIVRREKDRPQPRYDRDAENGMATVVGRISRDTIFDYKLVLLGHNTIRGAAGAAILNAELLVARGLLGKLNSNS